jgi:GT2 family glycosyltransferase
MHLSLQILGLFFVKPHKVIVAFYWLLLGKRKRAFNRLKLIESDHGKYQRWLLNEKNTLTLSSPLAESICFLIICCDKNGELTDNLHPSISTQKYKNWLIYDAKQVELPHFDYAIWVREKDQLSTDALSILANKLITQQHNAKTVDIAYSDHDYLYRGKREHPYFKGGWDPILLANSDYICGLCAISKDVILTALTNSTNLNWQTRYEILNSSESGATFNVLHIDAILYHVFKGYRGRPKIEEFQHSININSIDKNNDLGLYFSNKLRKELNLSEQSNLPLISILIPTRDMLSLLKPCIESILSLTSYKNYEIIILNNDSAETKTLDYFKSLEAEPKVKILDYSGIFNYSAINNFGVKHANGEYICLLNNDTKIIAPSNTSSLCWLSELMCWAIKPEVGAVGAKLFYADHSIQHAGVQIGLGDLAGHGHRFLKKNQSGYFYHAHLPQQVMAVTAACLLVNKAKFIQVGGLDEKHFSVAFNDVDLCLKLDKFNYKNIYEPRATLYHYESKSRGRDIKGEKQIRYLKEARELRNRWHTNKNTDRFYSRHLTRQREDFSIKG